MLHIESMYKVGIPHQMCAI